jgi:hypothetical protein
MMGSKVVALGRYGRSAAGVTMCNIAFAWVMPGKSEMIIESNNFVIAPTIAGNAAAA